MNRLEGDPGPLGWLRFTYGFRLPPENVHWVRHELTDAGWRRRTVLRHLAVVIPICAILVIVLAILLPAPIWVSLTMVALILCGSLFTVTAYADDLRVNPCASTTCRCPRTPTWAAPPTEPPAEPPRPEPPLSRPVAEPPGSAPPLDRPATDPPSTPLDRSSAELPGPTHPRPRPGKREGMTAARGTARTG